MIGGEIVQVIRGKDSVFVEVLCTTYFDRTWREIEYKILPKRGDILWWQSWKGYLSRGDHFSDLYIGWCKHSKHPAALPGEFKCGIKYPSGGDVDNERKNS
mgnify:CR=1 FL=1